MKCAVFTMLMFVFSCTASKIPIQKICSFRQGFLSYENITDSTYSLKLQKLGTNYLNFWVDSCSAVSNSTLRLIGYITYPDMNVENFQRKLSNVKIVQAIQVDKRKFKLLANVGATDIQGKFEIEVKLNVKNLFLLISKEGYNQTLVQFEDH